MTHWKHLVVALVAAFALAACSSSDNDTDTSTMMPTDPPPADMSADQRAAIMNAIEGAMTAVAAVDDDSTDAEVSEADTAIAAARSAIMAATDVPEEERNANTGTVDALASRLADAEMDRQAAMDDARSADDMAMGALAAKLYAGISAPTAVDASPEASIRFAAYNNAGDAINVQNGVATASAQELSEDKKTTIVALHDWEGKRYVASDDDVEGTYEAIVYSNVGDPTPGDKFSTEYTLTGADTTNPGETATLVTGSAGTTTPTELDVQARIASPSFDQSAGTKAFELPTNTVRVMRSGTYHGVLGTYYCTPAANNMCASQVAAEGFALGGVSDADDNPATPPVFTTTGGTWTFKPSNPDALVMSAADTVYASYGWWIHKSADDKTYTASAFVDEKDTVAPAADITALRGTATYRGGAAGKYALSSATGGTNDAGHFTARATLEADFGDDMITGTIDQFMGADGMSRNWSVELMESAIGNAGLIRRSDDDNSDLADTDPGAMTKWTIDGTEGDAVGSWTGALKDNGDDGVPKIATGTFDSTHGPGNSMVGAFGVNKQ